jgi:hypothetical protein
LEQYSLRCQYYCLVSTRAGSGPDLHLSFCSFLHAIDATNLLEERERSPERVRGTGPYSQSVYRLSSFRSIRSSVGSCISASPGGHRTEQTDAAREQRVDVSHALWDFRVCVMWQLQKRGHRPYGRKRPQNCFTSLKPIRPRRDLSRRRPRN